MKIAFRVDASVQIGTGHVMRCLTLADSLRDCGADICFICREHPGNLCYLIAGKGYPVIRLPLLEPVDPAPASASLAHAAWLGAGQQQDARECLAGLEDQLDWLIVDHYALNVDWENMLRPFTRRIMAIDDLADRAHDCDLLLDQNFVDGMHGRYVGKVPAACELLVGPTYALLQPVYAQMRETAAPKDGAIRRVLVYFGGADNYNLTGRALTAFLQLHRPDIAVDVVLGNACPHEQAIREMAKGHANVCVHGSLPSLAPILAQVDLAIGAGGATTWERMCLDVPSIVVTVASNQVPVAQALAKEGAIHWIGGPDEASVATIGSALSAVLAEGSCPGRTLRYRDLVDGRGSQRVCERVAQNMSSISSC